MKAIAAVRPVIADIRASCSISATQTLVRGTKRNFAAHVRMLAYFKISPRPVGPV